MSDLTGQIAQRTKQIKADEIMNEFLNAGQFLLIIGDLDGTLKEVERARDRFKQYGIDTAKFLSTGRV